MMPAYSACVLRVIIKHGAKPVSAMDLDAAGGRLITGWSAGGWNFWRMWTEFVVTVELTDSVNCRWVRLQSSIVGFCSNGRSDEVFSTSGTC